MIGEAFPGLSDCCGICFCVENTGFLVSGSMAHRMKNMLKLAHLPYCFKQQSTATFSHCSLLAHTHTAVWGWCITVEPKVAKQSQYNCVREAHWSLSKKWHWKPTLQYIFLHKLWLFFGKYLLDLKQSALFWIYYPKAMLCLMHIQRINVTKSWTSSISMYIITLIVGGCKLLDHK